MNILELKNEILEGNRSAISKSLTLVESQKLEHKKQSNELMKLLLPYTGGSYRIGITGAPGVGKSTFIESLGKLIVTQGKTLAVLTVDPTSPKSGGSILGDKTRMQEISNSERVMIRPSPSGLSGGGIGNNTRDQLLICEAAGFDAIIIETVGSGQGETAISTIVDFVLLLMQAGGGDELQGIKRGIMEIADAFAITKSEMTEASILNQSIMDLQNALHLLHSAPQPEVFSCSALKEEGIGEIWNYILKSFDQRLESGKLNDERERQDISYFDLLVKQLILSNFYNLHNVDELVQSSIEQIKLKKKTPLVAAEWVLGELTKKQG